MFENSNYHCIGWILFLKRKLSYAVIETHVCDRNTMYLPQGWLKDLTHATKFKVFLESFIIRRMQHFYPILKVKLFEPYTCKSMWNPYYSVVKPNRCTSFSNLFLFRNNTLHVSGGLFVHHQEFKTVHTATDICQTDTVTCLLASR
jgi:hypothetical protein